MWLHFKRMNDEDYVWSDEDYEMVLAYINYTIEYCQQEFTEILLNQLYHQLLSVWKQRMGLEDRYLKWQKELNDLYQNLKKLSQNEVEQFHILSEQKRTLCSCLDHIDDVCRYMAECIISCNPKLEIPRSIINTVLLKNSLEYRIYNQHHQTDIDYGVNYTLLQEQLFRSSFLGYADDAPPSNTLLNFFEMKPLPSKRLIWLYKGKNKLTTVWPLIYLIKQVKDEAWDSRTTYERIILFFENDLGESFTKRKLTKQASNFWHKYHNHQYDRDSALLSMKFNIKVSKTH